METQATDAAPPPPPAAGEPASESSTVGGEKRKREDDTAAEAPELEADEGRKSHPMWKTSLCSFYRRGAGAGGCSHGSSCRYAHGEEELRPRPDNSWDPTSDRAKKLLKPSAAAAASSSGFPAPEEVTVDEASLNKCLLGVPRNWMADKLKSFLHDQGISYASAKKKKGMTVGFVTFENVEQLKGAVEILNENSSGGKEIRIADANRRSHEKKHATEAASDDGVAAENGNAAIGVASAAGGLVSSKKSVRDVVTPLAHMPYIDQLEHKKNSLAQTLKRLTRNARKACPAAVPLPEWISKAKEIGGLPCKLEGILESPTVNGYRNKCEFSVGHSLEGKKTVGFMLGNFREGVTAVEEPVDCPNVSRISCKYALMFQDFLQSSNLPIWNRIDNSGFWRQFTVREGRYPGQAVDTENPETQISEVMLIVQVCSTGVDEVLMKDEFDKLSTALALWAAACSPPLPLTTIVVQDHKGISNAAPADCPLIPLSVPKVEDQSNSDDQTVDRTRIHDYIGNLRFSISPTAFFQVNTLAAERLYTLAGDWADLNTDTLLFDICCGTGTIGLTLASHVGMVVGIEMNESAVSDAQRNAVINCVKNCRFVCGKAEDVMGSLLEEYLGSPQQDSIVSKNTREVNGTDKNEYVADGREKNGGLTGSSDNGENQHSSLGTLDDDLSCANVEETMGTSENSESKDLGGGHDEGHEEDSGKQSNGKGSSIHEDHSDAATGESSECSKTRQDDPTPDNEGCHVATMCQFKNVVAIVDPPRVGLHPTVIKALRIHPRIRRLAYISCNPDSLVANAIELCTPTTAEKPEKNKGNRGWRSMSSAGLARQRTKSMPNSEPFVPVRAMAVDLFPHTSHCEMVMLFQR